MLRLLVLPVRFLLFPFRLAAGSARAGFYAGRVVGLSRSVFFGLGFATGVLVASPKARRLALAGTRRATVAVANTRREPPVPEAVVDPVSDLAAPHGVVLTDPTPDGSAGPTGPVLPTD